MATPAAVHHALLRPCILHILRAAGYHATKSSVLDTLTDLAARHMALVARAAVEHAVHNHAGEDLEIPDMRMALQDVGALLPEMTLQDQHFDNTEDTRGVDSFLGWCTGPVAKHIRHIALENGAESREDYLEVLKKKHSTTDEDTRYVGTIIGKPVESRAIKVEGGEIASLKEWAAKLVVDTSPITPPSSRRDSSDLSSLPDTPIELSSIMEMDTP